MRISGRRAIEEPTARQALNTSPPWLENRCADMVTRLLKVLPLFMLQINPRWRGAGVAARECVARLERADGELRVGHYSRRGFSLPRPVTST